MIILYVYSLLIYCLFSIIFINVTFGHLITSNTKCKIYVFMHACAYMRTSDSLTMS